MVLDWLIVDNIVGPVTVRQLENEFSRYGPSECCYACLRDDVRAFAHVVFVKASDAARAYEAGQRREIVLNGEPLVLTLISHNDTPINKLPTECLMHVFAQLEMEERLAVEDVCEKWKRVASDSWYEDRKFYVWRGHHRISDETFEDFLIRCGRFLHDIQFYLENDIILSLVTEHCKNLHSMKIQFNDEEMKVDYDSHLCSILEELKKIRRISLVAIPGEKQYNFLSRLSKEATEIHISSEDIHLMPDLEYITSDMFHFFNPTIIDVSEFKCLRALSLRGFRLCDDNFTGLESLENLVCLVLKQSAIDSSVIDKIQYLRKLEHLSIPSCSIQDDALQRIVINNRNLEFLDISHILDITDTSLQTISGLQNLKALKMEEIPHVTLEGITGFPSLIYLNCSKCDSVIHEGLINLIKNSPKLRILSAEYCPFDCKKFYREVQLIERFTADSHKLEISHHNYRYFVGGGDSEDECNFSTREFERAYDFFDAWSDDAVSWYNHDVLKSLDT